MALESFSSASLNIAFLCMVMIKKLCIAVENYVETIIHESFFPGYLRHSKILNLTSSLLEQILRWLQILTKMITTLSVQERLYCHWKKWTSKLEVLRGKIHGNKIFLVICFWSLLRDSIKLKSYNFHRKSYWLTTYPEFS